MNLNARLQKLERQHSQIERERFRIVVSFAGKPFDLTKATCTRTLWPNGQLMEMVNLHGGDYGLRDEDLERFIQSFPMKRAHDRQKSSPPIGTAGKRADT